MTVTLQQHAGDGLVSAGEAMMLAGFQPISQAPDGMGGYGSHIGWRPHVSSGERVPCRERTAKGGSCQMAACYDPDTGFTTGICRSHWQSAFKFANAMLSSLAQVPWASKPQVDVGYLGE